MHTEETTELRLLRHWRSGDRVAADQLLRRYTPLLRRYFAQRVTRNADELVQRTLVACIHGIERFEGRSSFKHYLLGIAQNQLLMSLRSDARAEKPAVFLGGVSSETPSQLLAVKEEQRILISALIQISPEFRSVLKMFYWDGQSVEEIAARLGAPHGTVKSRLARGRAMLKEKIRTMNVPPSIGDDALARFIAAPAPEGE